MSKQFNAQFNITGASQDGILWRVTGDVADFSPDSWSVLDVKPGDCFVDENSFFGTNNRWEVTLVEVTGASAYPGGNFNSIRLLAKWDDIGDEDTNGPGAGVGLIGRVSENKRILWAGAISYQGVSEGLQNRLRNINDFYSIDPFMNKYVKNMLGVTIPAYSVLCWLDDGTVGLAEADVSTKADIAGINTKEIADGSWGWIVKTGYIPNALIGLNATPGAYVYLSEESGRMTLTAPSPLSDTIMKIGRAEPPSGIVSAIANDLHMELEILAES